jgi:hypothetical protein
LPICRSSTTGGNSLVLSVSNGWPVSLVASRWFACRIVQKPRPPAHHRHARNNHRRHIGYADPILSDNGAALGVIARNMCALILLAFLAFSRNRSSACPAARNTLGRGDPIPSTSPGEHASEASCDITKPVDTGQTICSLLRQQRNYDAIAHHPETGPGLQSLLWDRKLCGTAHPTGGRPCLRVTKRRLPDANHPSTGAPSAAVASFLPISRRTPSSWRRHPRSANHIERRFRALEERLARLEQRQADGGSDDDGWECRYLYARRLGVSLSTVDRDVKRGLLEEKKEAGTRRAYVRPARRPPKPNPRRGRRRRSAMRGDDTGVIPSAAAVDPVVPFKSKEPPSTG